MQRRRSKAREVLEALPELLDGADEDSHRGENTARPWYRRMAVSIAVWTLACLFSSGYIYAQQFTLRNGLISASFDGHGLTSIRSLRSGEVFHLEKDAWLLRINTTLLGSDQVVPKVIQHGPQRLVYLSSIAGFTIQTTYKIAPSWDFITKTLRITRVPVTKYFIHSVEPLDLSLSAVPDSVYTPGANLPQLGETPAESRASTGTAEFAAFLRYPHKRGLMLTIQNPFLHVHHKGGHVQIKYQPEMKWQQSWGDFVTDTACIGLYMQTGRTLPREMRLEWKQHHPGRISLTGMDRGEVKALTAAVRRFLIDPSPSPISVEVGWTLNGYQINIATKKGRGAYKRIINATSALGIQYLIFAPTDSTLANIKDDTDSWKWSQILWLDLGQKIREGKWTPDKDALPPEVVDMLEYARHKHVGLLAYVFPSIPFSGNPSWVVSPKGQNFEYSTLASRAFQNFLIQELVEFKRRTGIAGYSFDYTYLNLPGSSVYAQWWGWRRVLEALRNADPGIIIDGRQTYQQYGAWTWLAGNYPHPTGTDEQPESFVPYPDLHFDRVSADRMRFTNYWYRNYQFAPESIMPGYAFHQTERSINLSNPNGAERSKIIYKPFRPRDWDQLGFRYSLLSSIATAGWNNVINMIPARDPQEAKAFQCGDLQWIRHWLIWTTHHKEYLQHTRTILGQPAMGKADGTAMILRDRGYIFLFNPNYKPVSVSFALNNAIGLTSRGSYLVKEIYPVVGDNMGNQKEGTWQYGDIFKLRLEGTSATVLLIEPASEVTKPILFNAQAGPIKPGAKIIHHDLQVQHISGEPGTNQSLGVLLPVGTVVRSVEVNGGSFPFTVQGRYISIHLRFRGIRFSQAQQIKLIPSGAGKLSGNFTVPARVFKQLAARRKTWPVHWTKSNYKTTWLVPERLLLFVQFAQPDAKDEVTIAIDGKRIVLRRAYSSVRVHAPSLVGWYADLTDVEPDVQHHFVLHIPPGSVSRFQGVFFDNVRPFWTEGIAR